MADSDTTVNASAGHLCVHVGTAYASDVPFAFEQAPKRLGVSFMAASCQRPAL